MSLVKVTAKERNGAPFAKDILIDLSRITEPIVENTGNDVVISLNETPRLKDVVNQGNNNVQYVLDIDLANFINLSTIEMFSGTVVLREGREPIDTLVGFFIDKIVGVMTAAPGGTEFFYESKGGHDPVKYLISDTPTGVSAKLLWPYVAGKPKKYAASLTQVLVDVPPVDVGITDTLKIGTPSVWDYTSPGVYTLTSEGTFVDADKIHVYFGKGQSDFPEITWAVTDVDTLTFTVVDPQSAYAAANDLLHKMAISIEVHE